jgi:hypothetical protein
MILFVFIVGYNSLAHAQSKGGRWQFENNGHDTADWDQLDDHGELIGPAYFSIDLPVPVGAGYLCLDSLEAFDFFKVADSEDLDFDNENIGISLWINPIVLNNVHYIVNKGIQDSNPKTTNYALRVSNGRRLEFLIRDSDNQAQLASSDITLTSGGWIFIAVYYDYSLKKVYFWNQLQEQPADTVDFDQDYFSNNDPLTIGSWSQNDTLSPSIRDFEGSLDDVRISGRLEDILPGVTSIQSDNIYSANFNRESVTVFPNPISISKSNNHIQFKIFSPNKNPINYTIYNILGQRVFKGTSGGVAGVKNIQWRMKDNFGHQIRTGVYFVEFKGLQNRVIKKFLIIK